MRQKLLHFSLLLFIAIFSFSQQALAEELEGSSREEVLTYLQNAFHAQISLTEKPRSQDEIKQILSTYFENELIEKYVEANVHPLDNQFIVYGTDFPMYTIPFFTYDERTKVLEQANERMIFEFFPATTDGPVGYDDHYEVVKMYKTNEGWKIYSIENESKQPEMIGEQTTLNEEITKGEGNVETEGEIQSIEKELNHIEINNNEENSKDQSQLGPFNIDATSSYINQSIKELNEVLFFSSFYLQTKNILNDYFLTKVTGNK
ncbi:MAG: DUF3993 domain-containing protein [Bacillota bacterium]